MSSSSGVVLRMQSIFFFSFLYCHVKFLLISLNRTNCLFLLVGQMKLSILFQLCDSPLNLSWCGVFFEKYFLSKIGSNVKVSLVFPKIIEL